MKRITNAGLLFFGLSMVAFGVEQFAFHSPLSGLMPIPVTVPAQLWWVYLNGLLLAAGGICIVCNIQRRLAAMFTALLLFVLFLLLHLPILIADLHNAGEWTVTFEILALCSGALLSAATSPLLYINSGSQPDNTNDKFTVTGRVVFIAALVVFGILHFMYADYIATLIPTWIPITLFWAYFVGVAFIATAVSIALNLLVQLSTLLLAAMFLLWVIVLHTPRVIANPQTEAEWTSLFVAAAMCGISLLTAGSAVNKQRRRL